MEEGDLTSTARKRSRKLVVIGGSAGALSMVLAIVQLLRFEMDVSVLVVLHRKQAEENVLLEVLSTKTQFKVMEAEDKDELLPGIIYLAPADYHVLVERDGTLTLDDSEKINFSRPSIDVSFESAAEIYGSSMVCILLSGANADGAEGMVAAKARGARIVIQDPASADFSYMPTQAVAAVKPDLLLNTGNLDQLKMLLTI